MADRATDEAERIPLVDEELRVEKRQVVTGKVRVRTVSEVVEEVARATLQDDVVEVARVPIDRVVEGDAVPEIRTEGDLTIVPVLEEVAVVVKRLVLKEELHIRRRSRAREVELPVELRRQNAVVERVPEADRPNEER